MSVELNPQSFKRHQFWLHCVKALLYRLFLQKWRRPILSLLELLFPLGIAYLITQLRWEFHDLFPLVQEPQRFYLSDSLYDGCPFGRYGPSVEVPESVLAVGAPRQIASILKDIECQHLFGVNLPAVISTLLGGSDVQIGDIRYRFKGIFSQFPDFSLTPFANGRRLKRFHLISALLHHFKARDPIINPSNNNDALCKQFERYVESLILSFLDKREGMNSKETAAESAVIHCEEIEDGGAHILELKVQLENALRKENPFPYYNKDRMYLAAAAEHYPKNEGRSLSAADHQLLISSFFSLYKQQQQSPQSDRSRGEHEAGASLDVPTISRGHHLIPEELQLIFDHLLPRDKLSIQDILLNDPIDSLQLFCILCHKYGSIYQHRPFFDCQLFGDFLELIGSTASPSNNHWDRLISQRPMGVPICQKNALRQVLPNINIMNFLKQWTQYVAPHERQSDMALSRHHTKSLDATSLSKNSSFSQNFSNLMIMSLPYIVNLFDAKGHANELTDQAAVLEDVFNLTMNPDALEFEKFNQWRGIFLGSLKSNRYSTAFYSLLLENVLYKWMTFATSPTLNAFGIREVGESSMPTPKLWWSQLSRTWFNSNLGPFTVFLIFLFPLYSISEIIMSDKETKMKQYLEIIGGTDLYYFGSIFLFFYLWIGIILIIFVYIFKSVYPLIPPIFHFIPLSLFSIQLVSFLILFSTFFQTHRQMLSVLVLFVFVSSYSYLIIESYLPLLHIVFFRYFLLFLLPFGTLMVIAEILSASQFNGIGDFTDQSSFGISTFLGLSFKEWKLYECCLAIISYSILYVLTGWYLSKVSTGRYGGSRPWYFPIALLFSKQEVKEEEKKPGDYQIHPRSNLFESEDHQSRQILMETKNLSKTYRINADTLLLFQKAQFCRAVQNVNLRIYEDEVFVLLGHNGAGKSTLFNMLVGSLTATSGDISICGHDLKTDASQAKHFIGFCPQENVHYDFMSIEEHLYMFGYLKGLQTLEIRSEIEQLLQLLNLDHKRKALVKTLSGGQKRRLNLMIALVGNPKILFLDEPSTGMDPYTRFFFWETIRRIKKGRAIVLTTHQMNEADTLGSRIGILVNGRLECLGTPYFLKQVFGVNYTLTIIKLSDYTTMQEIDLIHFIKDNIPEAFVLSNVSLEIRFRFPASVSSKVLPTVLQSLESEGATKYGVDNFLLSGTSLEDVFLRIEDSLKTHHATSATDQALSMRRYSLASTAAHLYCSQSSKSTFNGVDLDVAISTAYHTPVKELLADENSLFYSFDVSTNTPSNLEELSPIKTIIDESHYLEEHQNKVVSKNNSSNSLHLRTKAHKRLIYQMKALLIKRIISMYRDLWTHFSLILGPVCSLLIISLCFKIILGGLVQEVDPIAILREHTFAFPSPIYYAFSEAINEKYRNQEIDIFQNCNQKYWKPIYLNHIKTKLDMDEYLLALRQTDQDRFYFSFYFDITSSQPYPIILHDSAFKFSLHAAMSAYTDCQGRSIASSTLSHHSIEQQQNSLKISEGPHQVSDNNNKSTLSRINLHHFELLDSGVKTIFLKKPGKLAPFVNLFAQIMIVYIELNLLLSLPVVTISFVIKELNDKTYRAQQLVGVMTVTYWITNFIWDFILYFVSLFSLLLTMWYLSSPIIKTIDQLIYIIKVMLLFGMSSIWYHYFLIFFIPNETFLKAIITSSALFAPLFSLSWPFLKQLKLKVYWIWIGDWMTFLLPPLNASSSLILPSLTASISIIPGIERFLNSVLGIENSFQHLGLSGPIYMLLVILLDSLRSSSRVQYKLALIRNFILRKHRPSSDQLLDEDDDVVKERKKLQRLKYDRTIKKYYSVQDAKHEEEKETLLNDDVEKIGGGGGSGEEAKDNSILITEGLTKEFGFIQRNLAVNDLWLSVAHKECFGLLGVNGSGKTTTLQMLARNIFPTSGTARLLGVDLYHRRSQCSQLGYCAQSDALFNYMTAREHLYFYGRISGISEKHLYRNSRSILEALSLTEYADQKVEQLSGGNRRKLDVGLAFVQNPAVVCLDEPSAGVDPASRRKLWTIIERATQEKDKAIILTTHFLEDCEALCNRLTVMKEGSLICLGTPSHIKAKFGRSFVLEATLKVDNHLEEINDDLDQDELIAHQEAAEMAFAELVAANFKNAYLFERCNSHLKWSIPKDADVALSTIFRFMEGEQIRCLVETYSVAPASLESIFSELQNQKLGLMRS